MVVWTREKVAVNSTTIENVNQTFVLCHTDYLASKLKTKIYVLFMVVLFDVPLGSNSRTADTFERKIFFDREKQKN